MPTNVPRGTNSESKPQPGSKRLGRGLAQLLSGPPALDVVQSSGARGTRLAVADHDNSREALANETRVNDGWGGGGLRHLAVGSISPGKHQPRKTFDEGSLAGLAESIEHSGVMQPIVVRPSGKETYEIVAGERR